MATHKMSERGESGVAQNVALKSTGLERRRAWQQGEATPGSSHALLPFGISMEFEREHYTSWQCSVCDKWRDRSYPARVVVTNGYTIVQCREDCRSEADDDDECLCHCHESGFCDECGEPA